jgi:hypothetical protein
MKQRNERIIAVFYWLCIAVMLYVLYTQIMLDRDQRKLLERLEQLNTQRH